MNSLRILIIVSLIADKDKDFLTITSIYIQHLLRLKSLKKQLSTVSTTLKAWYSKCDFSYLSFPNMSTTSFSWQLCLIKGHRFLKKYEFFLSLLTPQTLWNILFSSESKRLKFKDRATGDATLFNQWESALVFINKQIKTAPQWSKIFKTTDGVGQNQSSFRGSQAYF